MIRLPGKYSPYTKRVFLVLQFLLLTSFFFPQKDSTTSLFEGQKDIVDVLRKEFRIKRDSLPDSVKVKPGRILAAILPAPGYAPHTGLSLLIAANVSFYTGKTSSTHLSTIVFSQNYTINRQIIIPVISNIWLKDNKLNLLGDWRYYKYPTYTYGLGSNTTKANADLIDYSYIKVHQQVLKKIVYKLLAGFGYAFDYHFNVAELGSQSNFQDYNRFASKTISAGPLLSVIYDSRTNINNPMRGMYCSIKFHPCYTALGSDNNWQSLIGEFRKYIPLIPSGRQILAFWSYNWFTFGHNIPYFDLPSTGWDTYANSGRGYLQGRFRSGNILYAEAEYRFTLTRNGLFGGVLFTNAQSVSDWPSGRFRSVFPAAGTGLRIKVNKYSRVNFAIDYAVGIGGSQGLYFNLSELF